MIVDDNKEQMIESNQENREIDKLRYQKKYDFLETFHRYAPGLYISNLIHKQALEKYKPFSWEIHTTKETSSTMTCCFDAIIRHLTLGASGVMRDAESGYLHLAHAVCRAYMLAVKWLQPRVAQQAITPTFKAAPGGQFSYIAPEIYITILKWSGTKQNLEYKDVQAVLKHTVKDFSRTSAPDDLVAIYWDQEAYRDACRYSLSRIIDQISIIQAEMNSEMDPYNDPSLVESPYIMLSCVLYELWRHKERLKATSELRKALFECYPYSGE